MARISRTWPGSRDQNGANNANKPAVDEVKKTRGRRKGSGWKAKALLEQQQQQAGTTNGVSGRPRRSRGTKSSPTTIAVQLSSSSSSSSSQNPMPSLQLRSDEKKRGGTGDAVSQESTSNGAMEAAAAFVVASSGAVIPMVKPKRGRKKRVIDPNAIVATEVVDMELQAASSLARMNMKHDTFESPPPSIVIVCDPRTRLYGMRLREAAMRTVAYSSSTPAVSPSPPHGHGGDGADGGGNLIGSGGGGGGGGVSCADVARALHEAQKENRAISTQSQTHPTSLFAHKRMRAASIACNGDADSDHAIRPSEDTGDGENAATESSPLLPSNVEALRDNGDDSNQTQRQDDDVPHISFEENYVGRTKQTAQKLHSLLERGLALVESEMNNRVLASSKSSSSSTSCSSSMSDSLPMTVADDGSRLILIRNAVNRGLDAITKMCTDLDIPLEDAHYGNCNAVVESTGLSDNRVGVYCTDDMNEG